MNGNYEKVKNFLNEFNLEVLEEKFIKLKNLYMENLDDRNKGDDNLINAHVLFQLVKINSLNSRSKDNIYKISKKTIKDYFNITDEKIMSMNFACSYFFSEFGYLNIKDYFIPFGENAYQKKLKNGAKKLTREFEDILIEGEVYHSLDHLHIFYCPYNMDAFFFEKLHLAFDINEYDIDFNEDELSYEFLFISYNNKEDHWTRYYLLFSSLLHNPFNVDSILEVSRIQIENAKRNAIIDYLIDYCDKHYKIDEGDFQNIGTKPYLRVLHQKALWLLEEQKIEEAKKFLYKCLEIRYIDPLGVRYILEEIDENFEYIYADEDEFIVN